MQETRVQSLGREDPPEKEMVTHSSTLAWKIPWTEEPCRPQSMGSPRVGHDWATSLSLFNVITYREGCRINKGWGAQRLLTIEKASAACVTPAQTELESSWGCCHRGMHERDTAPRQTGNKEESTQHSPFCPLISNQCLLLTQPNWTAASHRAQKRNLKQPSLGREPSKLRIWLRTKQNNPEPTHLLYFDSII